MSPAQKSARSSTAKGATYEGFTDEERGALTELTEADEARIVALLKRAVS